MSTKPENTFIASVHRHLARKVYRMKNNNPYLGGVPDCWYSGKRGDLWAEYKFVILPKKPDTLIKIDLSPLQLLWLQGRQTEGRNLCVIVGCKDGGVWLSYPEWEQTFTAAQFKSKLISRVDIAKHISSITV